MKRMSQQLFSSAIALLALAACTKELPFKEVYKEEVYDKPDTSVEYLYSSAMLNASRSSQDALPFSSSDNKRVRLEWTKDALRVMEIEKDARFQDNQTNNKLVLEIPVEHVDYQCAKDRYGECTSSEEENKDVSWNQKTKFKIKAEAAKSGTLDLLPILIDKTVGGSCYEEVSSKVLKVDLEKTAINLDVERTFKTNLQCLGNVESLSDATVSAVYHYSFVQVPAIVSKDFKPLSYPTDEQNEFGFFATEKNVLDSANNSMESGKQTLMNHWNPNRKEITYYLSDEFAKPENAVIKDLTYKTVDALNDGLAQSGAQFHINLQEPAHKNPGDIRNSMIILVEDPVASSVIGYGPQTEDPNTGEIVSARTVMFLGTIKKYIGYTYDEILREKRRALAEAQDSQKTTKTEDKTQPAMEKGLREKVASLKAMSFQSPKKAKVTPVSGTGRTSRVETGSLRSVDSIAKEVRNYTKRKNTVYAGAAKAHYKYLMEAKNCAFGLNADIIGTSISPRLADRFSADAKPWEQLSDSEKQDVINIILPEVWIPTLIHEMGHNLGLRHNFEGSEDPENFYTDAELKAKGIDHAIPFSTVMEYGDDLKALPILGKYDIAALRFAYARKVELKDGSIADADFVAAEKAKQKATGTKSADGTDAKTIELKDYKYCTDEHTGINAGCRRFDIGTSYTEIVQNEIKNYLEHYKIRNFRHGRSNMSLVDDPTYAAGIYDRFLGMRLMQETYERFQHQFNIPEDSDLWKTIPILADIKQASDLAGQFLLQVLETPDLTCVIAKKDKPTEIADVLPLAKLDATQISCFKVEGLNADYMVIGQYGKMFQSRKDPESQNAFADQIDVRGYWIDKLMASRVLFARQLGVSTLDQNTDNFFDRADLKESIQSSVHNILLNQVVGTQTIETATGQEIQAELPADTSTYVIEKPIFEGLATAFNLPDQAVPFSQVLASETARYMVSADHSVTGREFADTLKVVRTQVTDNTKVPKGALVMELGNDRFIASASNVIASNAIQTHGKVAVLEKVERKRLIEMYKAKKDHKPLPDLKKEEQAAWDVDDSTLENYLVGSLGSSEFYQNLINSLPN